VPKNYCKSSFRLIQKTNSRSCERIPSYDARLISLLVYAAPTISYGCAQHKRLERLVHYRLIYILVLHQISLLQVSRVTVVRNNASLGLQEGVLFECLSWIHMQPNPLHDASDADTLWVHFTAFTALTSLPHHWSFSRVLLFCSPLSSRRMIAHNKPLPSR
jgi:hypothetical protein